MDSPHLNPARREPKLQPLWLPLYDTQLISGVGSFSFFQNPSKYDGTVTNVDTAGQLMWPKRFSAVGVRFEFDRVVALDGIIARISVGETNYWKASLSTLHRYQTAETRIHLGAAFGPYANQSLEAVVAVEEKEGIKSKLVPIFIPPVTNFRVEVNVSAAIEPVNVRAILDGTLWREVA